MYKECFRCASDEGDFIPAPGGATDEEGMPTDWVCHHCYDEITGRVEAAGALREMRGDMPANEQIELDEEYAALQGNWPYGQWPISGADRSSFAMNLDAVRRMESRKRGG